MYATSYTLTSLNMMETSSQSTMPSHETYFQHDPIDLDTRAFRLLRLARGDGEEIECEVFQAFLEDKDGTITYEALSYTWGDPCGPTRNIVVNKKPFRVGTNLYEALQHLRMADEDRILWIDAISIDQESNNERGHQVKQMADIYRKAEGVVIWLGPATYDL